MPRYDHSGKEDVITFFDVVVGFVASVSVVLLVLTGIIGGIISLLFFIF